MKDKITIIIVNYNNYNLTINCALRTLRKIGAYINDFIIVDNCSTDDSLLKIKLFFQNYSQILVVESDRNGGFGYGCNLGARHARGDVLWFLNSDAWLSEGNKSTIKQTTRIALDGKTGLVGTAVLLDDGSSTPQGGSDMSFKYFLFSSFRFGKIYRSLPASLRLIASAIVANIGLKDILNRYESGLLHNHEKKPYECPCVGGASFFIEKNKFSSLGGFDERFFLYDEDGDLCLRTIDAGMINYVNPNLRVATKGSASTSKLPKMRLKVIKMKSRFLLISKHFSGLKKNILLLVTAFTWPLL